MQYGKAFGYFARKPGSGRKNLLMASLCLAIPVVGGIVILGYRAMVTEDLERDPDGRQHRDFDFNRFVEYLERGLWPFLTSLIFGFAIAIPVYGVATAAGFATYYATEEKWAGIVVGYLLVFILAFGSLIFSLPMMLHAMKSRKFNLLAEIGFAGKMLRVVGLELVFSVVVWNFIGFWLMILGLLLCYVGVFPAIAIATMAQQHLMMQLYKRYLEEGGPPIPEPTDRPYADGYDDDPDDYDDRPRPRRAFPVDEPPASPHDAG